MTTMKQIHETLQQAAADGRALDVHGYQQRLARAFAAGRRGKSRQYAVQLALHTLRADATLTKRERERVEMFVDEWHGAQRIRCWERVPC